MTYSSPTEALHSSARSDHAVDDVVDLVLHDPPKKPAGAVGRLVTVADGRRLEVAVSKSDAEHIDALAEARSSIDERKESV